MTLLPLTAFENYMILDDHPGYEMVVLMEWAFRGKINRDLLVEAYKRITQYEPLFRAVLVKKRGQFYWDVDDKYLAQLVFESSDKSVEEEGDDGTRYMVHLDPGKECAKIFVKEMRDGVIFDVFVHHAIGDGIGVYQFFANWMKEYDLLLHGQTDTSALNFHPDINIFERREERHFVPKEKPTLSKALRNVYKGVSQFFCRRVLPLLKEDNADKSKISDIAPMYWRRFGEDFFLKYKVKAKSLNVSVNTLMIRDMYITLRKWNEKYPVDDKPIDRQRRWFRMLVPMNIRTEFHQTAPSANILGYIFLDRRPVSCDRSDEFLRVIQENMNNCKKYQSGALFVSAIQVLRKIPGIMPLMTSEKKCHCSMILSSVGNICKGSQQEDYRKNDNIFVVHDQYPLELFRMIGAPPTRPHTPISIGVMQRQNEALISCRYDLNVMTEQTMSEFYNMFVDEMMKSLEE